MHLRRSFARLVVLVFVAITLRSLARRMDTVVVRDQKMPPTPMGSPAKATAAHAPAAPPAGLSTLLAVPVESSDGRCPCTRRTRWHGWGSPAAGPIAAVGLAVLLCDPGRATSAATALTKLEEHGGAIGPGQAADLHLFSVCGAEAFLSVEAGAVSGGVGVWLHDITCACGGSAAGAAAAMGCDQCVDTSLISH